MLEKIKKIPLDPIFKLLNEYNKDKRSNKINLGIGLYTDQGGNPFVCKTIKKVWKEIDTNNFNYQPIQGNKQYLELTAKLILGTYKKNNLAMQATCGGTNACSLFTELFIQNSTQKPTILITTPTWPNHLKIFKNYNIKQFPHLKNNEVNYEKYKEEINN